MRRGSSSACHAAPARTLRAGPGCAPLAAWQRYCPRPRCTCRAVRWPSRRPVTVRVDLAAKRSAFPQTAHARSQPRAGGSKEAGLSAHPRSRTRASCSPRVACHARIEALWRPPPPAAAAQPYLFNSAARAGPGAWHVAGRRLVPRLRTCTHACTTRLCVCDSRYGCVAVRPRRGLCSLVVV